jgi:hypothetical protein
MYSKDYSMQLSDKSHLDENGARVVGCHVVQYESGSSCKENEPQIGLQARPMTDRFKLQM